MCLFWEEEDFGKINSLYFFNIESLKTFFFIVFQKLCNAGLTLRFISAISQNKHISQYKHTFFGLTKMCLLWGRTVKYNLIETFQQLQMKNCRNWKIWFNLKRKIYKRSKDLSLTLNLAQKVQKKLSRVPQSRAQLKNRVRRKKPVRHQKSKNLRKI